MKFVRCDVSFHNYSPTGFGVATQLLFNASPSELDRDNSTYDHPRPTSNLDVENSSSTICADWQPARGFSAVNLNSHHSGNNGLKTYFQNISGMITKTQSVFMNTSNSDYDNIILVETLVRMNSSILNYSKLFVKIDT